MSLPFQPCPACQAPLVIVRGSTAGICSTCRRPYQIRGGLAQAERDGRWPVCLGAPFIGQTLKTDGSEYTVFAAIDWQDIAHDSLCTELYLANAAGDEFTFEFENDDVGRVVWWRSHDITGQVSKLDDGSVEFGGRIYKPHSKALPYNVKTASGSFDDRYTRNESTRVQWYKDFAGTLDMRKARIGRTEESGREVWFLLSPAARPALNASSELRRQQRAVVERQHMVPFAIGAFLLLLAVILHFALSLSASNAPLYDSGELDTSGSRHWISDPFRIAGSHGNVEARLIATPKGGWTTASLCLARTDIGDRYCVQPSVYSDSGFERGAWGRSELAYFSSVPAGTYVLEGQIDTDSVNVTESFQVQLRRNVVRDSYLLWAVLGMLAIPLIVATKHLSGHGDMPTGEFARNLATTLLFVAFMVLLIYLDNET